MKKTTIKHRGEVLKQRVEQSGIVKTRLPELTHFGRTTYYLHIQRADLKFEILLRYGKAIKHDFAEDFPELIQYNLITIDESIEGITSLEEAKKVAMLWKKKYYGQLEQNRDLSDKYQAVLEQLLKVKR